MTDHKPPAEQITDLGQARGIALRLHAAIEAANVDLAAVDRHLARAITEDRTLAWLRGEMPPRSTPTSSY